jgi:hypothetical protein
VGGQEVKRDDGGTSSGMITLFFYENWSVKGHTFFVPKVIISAVKFVSNRVSYIIWRGCWSGIFFNVHSPADDNSDDERERFHEEVQHMFDHFPKYNMKIFLREEDMFKRSIGEEGLHATS